MDILKRTHIGNYVSHQLLFNKSFQLVRKRLGPHVRGIEPEWYPEAANNKVKLMQNDSWIYYGQV